MVQQNSICVALVICCLWEPSVVIAQMTKFSNFAILVSICVFLRGIEVLPKSTKTKIPKLASTLVEALISLVAIGLLMITWNFVESVIGCFLLSAVLEQNNMLSWVDLKAVRLFTKLTALAVLFVTISKFRPEVFSKSINWLQKEVLSKPINWFKKQWQRAKEENLKEANFESLDQQ